MKKKTLKGWEKKLEEHVFGEDTTVSKSASVTGLYRSLDMGEIILEGDEGSPDKKTWVKITRDDPWGWVIGMTVCMMVPNIRREI